MHTGPAGTPEPICPGRIVRDHTGAYSGPVAPPGGKSHHCKSSECRLSWEPQPQGLRVPEHPPTPTPWDAGVLPVRRSPGFCCPLPVSLGLLSRKPAFQWFLGVGVGVAVEMNIPDNEVINALFRPYFQQRVLRPLIAAAWFAPSHLRILQPKENAFLIGLECEHHWGVARTLPRCLVSFLRSCPTDRGQGGQGAFWGRGLRPSEEP